MCTASTKLHSHGCLMASDVVVGTQRAAPAMLQRTGRCQLMKYMHESWELSGGPVLFSPYKLCKCDTLRDMPGSDIRKTYTRCQRVAQVLVYLQPKCQHCHTHTMTTPAWLGVTCYRDYVCSSCHPWAQYRGLIRTVHGSVTSSHSSRPLALLSSISMNCSRLSASSPRPSLSSSHRSRALWCRDTTDSGAPTSLSRAAASLSRACSSSTPGEGGSSGGEAGPEIPS